MHVISRKKCRVFCGKHPSSCGPLDFWYGLARHAAWGSFDDVRKTFGRTVDRHGECYIFNVHGNHYRLIAKISPDWKRLYIKYILTHKDYDDDDWKGCC